MAFFTCCGVSSLGGGVGFARAAGICRFVLWFSNCGPDFLWSAATVTFVRAIDARVRAISFWSCSPFDLLARWADGAAFGIELNAIGYSKHPYTSRSKPEIFTVFAVAVPSLSCFK